VLSSIPITIKGLTKGQNAKENCNSASTIKASDSFWAYGGLNAFAFNLVLSSLTTLKLDLYDIKNVN
jgi:hypothetical protein